MVKTGAYLSQAISVVDGKSDLIRTVFLLSIIDFDLLDHSP